MPKVVNKRARVHVAAAHISKRAFAHGSAVERIVPESTDAENSKPVTATVPGIVPLNVDGSADTLISSKPATKREKREQRRKQLLARLEHTHNDLLNAKKAKQKASNDKRKKNKEQATSHLLTDWSELSRTVQGMDMALQMKDKHQQPDKQPGTRKRDKIAKNEMARFQAVLGHPAFKANPLTAIRQHVENTFGKPATMTDKSMSE
ncbi:ribosome biogenesis protein SLX9-domain-containing protein [Syncephalis plumigaleata]|nr:ribosome biogenesis protein SLX9-domain-containing protein [Syncephalis plumigaleata]